MLMLVHVGGVCFDALQAVLMRSSATFTQRPCTQKTLMVDKAIFPLLWAWVYTNSASTPGGPRTPPSPAGARRTTRACRRSALSVKIALGMLHSRH